MPRGAQGLAHLQEVPWPPHGGASRLGMELAHLPARQALRKTRGSTKKSLHPGGKTGGPVPGGKEAGWEEHQPRKSSPIFSMRATKHARSHHPGDLPTGRPAPKGKEAGWEEHQPGETVAEDA